MTKEVYPEVISQITRIVQNGEWPDSLRVMALQAFTDYERPEVEDALIRVSLDCPLPISAYAADILAQKDFARYRDFLHQLSNNWPENAQYPASDVREMLAKEPTD